MLLGDDDGEAIWRAALVPPQPPTLAADDPESAEDKEAADGDQQQPQQPQPNYCSNRWLRAAARLTDRENSDCRRSSARQESSSEFVVPAGFTERYPSGRAGRWYSASVTGGHVGSSAVAPVAAARRLAAASRALIEQQPQPPHLLADVGEEAERAGPLVWWAQGVQLMSKSAKKQQLDDESDDEAATALLAKCGDELFWPQLLIAEGHRRRGRLSLALEHVERALQQQPEGEEDDLRCARSLRQKIILHSYAE